MHQAFTAKCQLGPFFNWLGFLVQFISLVFYVYYTQACRLQAFCRQYYAYLHYAVLAPKVSSGITQCSSGRVASSPPGRIQWDGNGNGSKCGMTYRPCQIRRTSAKLRKFFSNCQPNTHHDGLLRWFMWAAPPSKFRIGGLIVKPRAAAYQVWLFL